MTLTMTNSFLYSPWSLVHMNAYWTFDTGHGEVTANFDKATELTTGESIVSGLAVDEYGWWHRRASICLSNVRNLRRANGYREPDDAPFQVTVTFEWRMRCLRLVIPDDAARRLNRWKIDHWTEVYGYATGYTSAARRGTWEHRALAYLHAVQSRLDDDLPFIEGESFASMKDEHGHAIAGAYDLMPSTCGVCTDPANPTTGFHFAG